MQQLTMPEWRILARGIRRLPHLTNLALTFWFTYQAEPLGLNLVFRNLKELKHLTSFELVILTRDKRCHLVNSSFTTLAGFIRQQTKLGTLILSFNHYHVINDEHVFKLISSIRSLKTLTKLKLNLRAIVNLSAKTIEMLAETLLCLPQLSSLHLSLEDNPEVPARAFSALSVGLATLTQLNHLYLNFSYNPLIQDTQVNDLCISLSQMPKLTNLSLIGARCSSLTNLTMQSMIQHLGKLPNLQHIELDFKENPNLVGREYMLALIKVLTARNCFINKFIRLGDFFHISSPDSQS
jgi:hypothetical protein